MTMRERARNDKAGVQGMIMFALLETLTRLVARSRRHSLIKTAAEQQKNDGETKIQLMLLELDSSRRFRELPCKTRTGMQAFVHPLGNSNRLLPRRICSPRAERAEEFTL